MSAPPTYRVDDRSILLPYYRRYLVDPVLPLVPAWISPNWITHAGHASCFLAAMVLIAIWPSGGAPFAVAALLLQIYIWCDNADGAHARRTSQTSPFGEYLDHGLDILNTVYMGFLTASALGATPVGWISFVVLIPGAAAIVMWEQAATGVYRLGLINQIESSIVLCAALLGSAIWERRIFETTQLFGIELRLALLLWCAATIVFGVCHGMVRVARAAGYDKLGPAVILVLFGALSIFAVWRGALGVVPAVSIMTGVNVAFCARMLTSRLHRKIPRTMPTLWLVLAVVGSAVVFRELTGEAVPSGLIAAAAVFVFAAQTYSDARVGFSSLAEA